jgi:glycosidase
VTLYEAADEIESLRTDYVLLSDDYKQLLGDNERLRSRLAEIIGYCAQEGHDGEPYDTINAIAAGEYSTRGGGR